MAENSELVENRKYALQNIFVTEEDKNGVDILKMSDFFTVCISNIERNVHSDTAWEICHGVEEFSGEIATAIKGGLDISKMGTLVADGSHFSRDIVDGLKSGIYHVGESREVAGNLRPAILDEDEQLVKFFTLKKALNPTQVLSDFSAFSMQMSLKKISAQMEEIEDKVQALTRLERREQLSNKFINARNKIMSAANVSGKEIEECLKAADTYLEEGLTALYSDLNDQIKELSKQTGPLAKIKKIDSLLTYISEDMQMIPKYVCVCVYLFNYRGLSGEAERILDGYRYQLEQLVQTGIYGGKSAVELIHQNYQYGKDNLDFWLEAPKQMLNSVDAYKMILEQKDSMVFYIDAEENTDE